MPSLQVLMFQVFLSCCVHCWEPSSGGVDNSSNHKGLDATRTRPFIVEDFKFLVVNVKSLYGIDANV